MHQSLCTLNLNALTATRAVKMNICVCSQKERKKIHVKKKKVLSNQHLQMSIMDSSV